jgi:predicted nicotinamide N-methyase
MAPIVAAAPTLPLVPQIQGHRQVARSTTGLRAGSIRGFVAQHTRLQPVPTLGLRLHLADDILGLWRATQLVLRDPEAPLPYWGFAWAGGMALAKYLREHPETVAGRRVVDLASGSGLVAIAAMRAGASEATAIDIDPFAIAAIGLNAAAAGVRVAALRRDMLGDDPPDAEVLLAGDCWYEAGFAARVTPFLRRARERGIEVLVGDPGRRYLPVAELSKLASYEVRTTTELEDLDLKRGMVYALRATGGPEDSTPPR